MKKRDFQDLKNKITPELRKELSEAREKLRKLKFDLAAGKVKNVREIKDVKKYIAVLLTTLNLRKD